MKLTFKYLKTSFLALALAAAVPAVIMGLFARPFTSLTFLPEYYTSASGRFQDVFWMLIEPQSFTLVFPYILIVPLLLISCAYGMGMIEKHFKTGKLRVANPLRAVNNTILSVLKTVPILLGLIFLMFLLQSGMIALIRRIISGPYNAAVLTPPTVVDCIWATVFSLAVYFVSIVLSLIIGVWAVTMQIYGYSFGDAFVETMRTVSKKWFSLVVGLLLPLTVLAVPQIIVNIMRIVSFDFDFLQITVSIFTHFFMIIYYFAYTVVSVYHLNGLERRDNKRMFPFGIFFNKKTEDKSETNNDK